MKFSENLRNLRKEKDYSQEYLAEIMGVSRQTVSKWENGTAMPDLKKLTELAEFFGTTMDGLLGIEGTDSTNEKETIDIKHYNYYLQQLEERYDVIVEQRQKEFESKLRWYRWVALGMIVVLAILFTHQISILSNDVADLEEQVDRLQNEQDYEKQEKEGNKESEFVSHEILSVDTERPYIANVRCAFAPEEYANGTRVFFTKTVGKKTDKYEAKLVGGKFVAEFTVDLSESYFCSLIIDNGTSTKTFELDPEFDTAFIDDYLSVNANCYYLPLFETRNSTAPYMLEFNDNNAGQNICLSTDISGKIKAARLVIKDYYKNKDGTEIYSENLKIKKNATDYSGDIQIIPPKKISLKQSSGTSYLCVYAELTGEDGTVYTLNFNGHGDEETDTYDLYGGSVYVVFPDGTKIGK